MASFWDRPRLILSVDHYNLILWITHHRLVFPVPGGPQRRINLFQLIVHLSSFRAEKDTMRPLNDIPKDAVSTKITHPFELWRGVVLTVEAGRTADYSYSSVRCHCFKKRGSSYDSQSPSNSVLGNIKTLVFPESSTLSTNSSSCKVCWFLS
jgi:hypothetical protein